MNKLEGITEVILTLDKLNNANNIKNRRPSNTLFMYHVTAYKEFTQFTPQYKKLNPPKPSCFVNTPPCQRGGLRQPPLFIKPFMIET